MAWWWNCLAAWAAWRGRAAVRRGDLDRFAVFNAAFKRWRQKAGQ